jgi:glutathione reductase (NADPH)
MSIEDFDLITIGAGSGGVAASRRAASFGARVAIVERSRIGGTCVIRGCVPKKLMMYAAGYREALREARGYGWADAAGTFEMARWADAKAREIDRLEGVYRELLANAKVRLVEGNARIVPARDDERYVVEVTGAAPTTAAAAGATAAVTGAQAAAPRRLRAPRLLIATGSAPVRDAIAGAELAMTSNELLDLRDVPRRLLVLGGGYIAVEFASILAGLGAEVVLACRRERPLHGFDDGLRQRLVEALEARGIRVAAGASLLTLQRDGSGFVLQRGDGSTLRADAVLNALGRAPTTAGLGLEAIGVTLTPGGAVAVDADGRTSAKNVWAIGDVTDRVNLTPVAIADGRAFADTEFGRRPTRVDHRLVATAVFTDPPIGTVGLTEADAAALGPVDVYVSDFRPMKTAFIGDAARTWMKLVVDGRNDRVLGVHMIGADAPEIVQSLAVAVTCGATKRDFDRTVAVHPTAAEEFMLMREPVRRTAA